MREDPVDPFSVTFDDFEEYDKTKPPLIFPGVYAFLKKGASGKLLKVYIGESKNIPQRIKQHKRKKWYEEDLEIRVLWAGDDEVRLITETVMILKERPLENKAIKLGLAKKTGRVYPINFVRASGKG